MEELEILSEQYERLVDELKTLQEKEQWKKNEIRDVLIKIKILSNKSFLNRH
jgi:hypothetical protein